MKSLQLRYFRHNTRASIDPRMIGLTDEWGSFFVGLYWLAVEILSWQPEQKMMKESLVYLISLFVRPGRKFERRFESILRAGQDGRAIIDEFVESCLYWGLLFENPRGVSCPDIWDDAVAVRDELRVDLAAELECDQDPHFSQCDPELSDEEKKKLN